jgi:hypothetical protein
LRKRYGQIARTRAKFYSHERMIDRYVALIEEVMAQVMLRSAA